jgi:hypothetical protein
MSLNVSTLTACSLILDTVDKSRNKHEAINFITAIVATGKRKFAEDLYSRTVKLGEETICSRFLF